MKGRGEGYLYVPTYCALSSPFHINNEDKFLRKFLKIERDKKYVFFIFF